jgi:DNA-binding response OmpR family regulator
MLTALSSVDEKIAGLEGGADDYLTKPFHFRELLARVRALTRRKVFTPNLPEILIFADLELDTSGKTAKRAGKHITLTAREYALLELFMKNPNKMLSKTHIAEKIWGIDFEQGTNVVEVYINYLRNKIEKGFDKRLLHTMIGMGYILKEE